MKICKKTHKNIVAFLYGELEEKKQKDFLSHLKECAHCRSELERLREIKNSAESLQTDIEEAMASIDWQDLPARITEAVFDGEAQGRKESLFSRISSAVLQPRMRPVYAALILGILLGSIFTLFIFRGPLLRQEGDEIFNASQSFIERVELEMARRETLNYLEKSQYLILDLVQASPEKEASAWQREFASQRAKDLLTKKKYINKQLDKFQMAKAKEICDQIEFLFYELAQMTDQAPPQRLREIRSLIEERQLLLKIKLLMKELEKSKKSEV